MHANPVSFGSITDDRCRPSPLACLKTLENAVRKLCASLSCYALIALVAFTAIACNRPDQPPYGVLFGPVPQKSEPAVLPGKLVSEEMPENSYFVIPGAPNSDTEAAGYFPDGQMKWMLKRSRSNVLTNTGNATLDLQGQYLAYDAQQRAEERQFLRDTIKDAMDLQRLVYGGYGGGTPMTPAPQQSFMQQTRQMVRQEFEQRGQQFISQAMQQFNAELDKRLGPLPKADGLPTAQPSSN